MEREGLSEFALAKELGGTVAHTTVARWLQGSKPRTAQKRLLVERFKLDPLALFDDKWDLTSAGLPLYAGEYVVQPEKMQAVREDVERRADAKMWEAVAPRLPILLKKVGNIYAELDAIRNELIDFMPEDAAAKILSGGNSEEHPLIQQLRMEAEKNAYLRLAKEQEEKAGQKGKSQHKEGPGKTG